MWGGATSTTGAGVVFLGFAKDCVNQISPIRPFHRPRPLTPSFPTGEHPPCRGSGSGSRARSTPLGIAGGGWLYIFILLEFQSNVDPRMALRMMEYTAGIWKGLEKEDLGPDGEYPFVLPIVIYNGERRWTAATDIADLLAPAPEALLGYRPRHRYLLIEIQAEDPSSLPPDNVLAMITRFEQAPTAEALEELIGPLADWLERTGEPKLVEAFMAWITQVLVQRFGPSGKELQRKLRNEEEEKMTTLIERARKWGEERDQLWLQKGIEKGIERGRVEGERELVHRRVTRRFGPRTADQLLPLLDQLSEPEPIAAVADAVVESETAEEFLGRVKDVCSLRTEL